MQPRRYRCAPFAALLLAGASIAILPGISAAQGFSAGTKSATREIDVPTDAGADRHHFDRRRFEEARRDMERSFEDRHDWRDRDFHHEHHRGFHSGMMERMRERERQEQSRFDGKQPGVAKNGPDKNAHNHAEPGKLVGNRTANLQPVAAPDNAKSAPGGPMHQWAKEGTGNQPGLANAKVGAQNHAADKNGNRQAPGNFVGNPNAVGNNANLQAANARNLGMQARAQQGHTNPVNQQANAGNGARANNGNRQQIGNRGQQACAKQGPGNHAMPAKPNATNKNGNANHSAQMRGNLVGSRSASNAHPAHRK